MAWPGPGQRLPECGRLHDWLCAQDAHVALANQEALNDSGSSPSAARVQKLLQAQSPLLWIESADVSAARAAVKLAALSGATVHVAQSPGAHNMSAVSNASGTFGTSLSEVAAHADLIIHLGHQHLLELPLLGMRFLETPNAAGENPTRKHIFIGDAVSDASFSEAINPDNYHKIVRLGWPRHQWLDHFTRVLMAARPTGALNERGSETIDLQAIDSQATELAEALAASRYSVFLWGEDEFADELDRLMIQRLHEVADHFSQTTRCSLLPLSTDPGRTTAKDTLLWLTNVANTCRFVDGRWLGMSAGSAPTLDQWQQEHDWILCLRNLPSDRPLPDLSFDVILDAAVNVKLAPGSGAASKVQPEVLLVEGVGIEASGHLTRIDHGFGAYMQPVASGRSTSLPSAASVLSDLTSELLSAAGSR